MNKLENIHEVRIYDATPSPLNMNLHRLVPKRRGIA